MPRAHWLNLEHRRIIQKKKRSNRSAEEIRSVRQEDHFMSKEDMILFYSWQNNQSQKIIQNLPTCQSVKQCCVPWYQCQSKERNGSSMKINNHNNNNNNNNNQTNDNDENQRWIEVATMPGFWSERVPQHPCIHAWGIIHLTETDGFGYSYIILENYQSIILENYQSDHDHLLLDSAVQALPKIELTGTISTSQFNRQDL